MSSDFVMASPMIWYHSLSPIPNTLIVVYVYVSRINVHVGGKSIYFWSPRNIMGAPYIPRYLNTGILPDTVAIWHDTPWQSPSWSGWCIVESQTSTNLNVWSWLDDTRNTRQSRGPWLNLSFQTLRAWGARAQILVDKYVTRHLPCWKRQARIIIDFPSHHSPPLLMILLQPNKKGEGQGKKCHTRSMMT